MIKYFHELTKDEAKAVVSKGIADGLTWQQFAELYPQPIWCSYPDAPFGIMGCWSLIESMVTGEEYCKDCECHVAVNPISRED